VNKKEKKSKMIAVQGIDIMDFERRINIGYSHFVLVDDDS